MRLPEIRAEFRATFDRLLSVEELPYYIRMEIKRLQDLEPQMQRRPSDKRTRQKYSNRLADDPALADRVRQLHAEYPRWAWEKINAYLRDEGIKTNIGRISEIITGKRV